jgi:hypothetical protein
LAIPIEEGRGSHNDDGASGLSSPALDLTDIIFEGVKSLVKVVWNQ